MRTSPWDKSMGNSGIIQTNSSLILKTLWLSLVTFNNNISFTKVTLILKLKTFQLYWFLAFAKSNLMKMDGYEIHRCGRKKRTHGGVMVYTQKALNDIKVIEWKNDVPNKSKISIKIYRLLRRKLRLSKKKF